jgi:hypothetical protein
MEQRRIAPPRPLGITARTLTLKGLIDLRDRLKGEDPEVVRLVREQNKDVYFRDKHGSLRRVFPKRG